MSKTDFQRLASFCLDRQWTAQEITQRQTEIFRQTLALSSYLDGPNFTNIHASDVQRMCLLYDDHFFDGRLVGLARREGIDFDLSRRMTKAAGKTVTTFDTRSPDPSVPGGNNALFRSFYLPLYSIKPFTTWIAKFVSVVCPVAIDWRPHSESANTSSFI